MTKLELMRLSETQDDDAFDFEDFPRPDNRTDKDKYKDLYNDIKQPSDYIKEDW